MSYDTVRELSYEMEADNKLFFEMIFPKGQKVRLEKLDLLMNGAIDTHIHPAPDANATRPFDDIQLAIQACEAGMGAVVFKCHSFPTVRSAIIAQRVVDEWAKENGKKSTKVVGGVVLNYNVGGLNPEAVEAVARFESRFIWTPNLDSSHHRKVAGGSGGIEVLDSRGKVVPELINIFKLIAKHDLVLSITHHNTKERFLMIDAALDVGVKRIEICHPNAPTTKMSIDQMKIAAEKGAYLGIYCVNFAPPLFSINETMEIIKEVGTDRIVLGTDLGNWRLPPPVVNYRILLGLLLEKGVAEGDIEKMAKLNAQTLIF
jgi:predicted metal-dependent TIM-barrel fold hydrolase